MTSGASRHAGAGPGGGVAAQSVVAGRAFANLVEGGGGSEGAPRAGTAGGVSNASAIASDGLVGAGGAAGAACRIFAVRIVLGGAGVASSALHGLRIFPDDILSVAYSVAHACGVGSRVICGCKAGLAVHFWSWRCGGNFEFLAITSVATIMRAALSQVILIAVKASGAIAAAVMVGGLSCLEGSGGGRAAPR